MTDLKTSQTGKADAKWTREKVEDAGNKHLNIFNIKFQECVG